MTYFKEIDHTKVHRMITDNHIPQTYFARRLKVENSKGKLVSRSTQQINRCLIGGVGKALLEKITLSLIAYMKRKYGAEKLNLKYFYKG